jgi:hypothetical protein
VNTALHDQIEVIESGYEFLLAYAAQGRDNDVASTGGSEVRDTLSGMDEAATNIASLLATEKHAFTAVIKDDIGKSQAAISLVLAQETISSELIDNLNASIHLRALLTDLFLISDAVL